jgi:hypothetical protein
MANTFKFGNGQWAVKDGYALAYNDENGNFKPLPFDFTRATSATRVNKQGLIETVASGVPRIDFLNDSKGALLLEPTRSNNLLQSNQFDTTWGTSSGVTITSEQAISPDGSNNGWKFEKTAASYKSIGQSYTSSSETTFSIFAKKGTLSVITLFATISGASNLYQIFDLENGTISSGSGMSNSNIEDFGNGWYRCSSTFTNANVTSLDFFAEFSENNAGYIYIYGAQAEQGSYATSIINTSGSAVTRVQDACYNDNLGNVIGQTEGTFYIETTPLSSSINFTERMMQFESSGSGFITFQRYSNSTLLFYGTNGVNNWGIEGLNVFVGGETIKIAGAYKDNDIVLYVNGVQIGTNNTASSPQVDRMWFANNSGGSLAYSGSHKEVKFYNTRLSNTELQALTS